MATGRRKEAVARVRVRQEGTGKITVNGRDYLAYFPSVDQRMQVRKPLITAAMETKLDIMANVCGGGICGQAGAISLGISRCILAMQPETRSILRKNSLLTRDPRTRERKKYGRKGARRRFQWTKR